MIRAMLIIFFALGYLWLGLFGTGTKLVFQWPGLLLFGCGFVLLPFIQRKSILPTCSVPCLIFVTLLLGYMVSRAFLSPVFYLARGDIIFVITVFGAYVAFVTCFSDNRPRLIFIFLLLLLGAANTVCAVYQLKVDAGFTMLPGYERQGAGGQLNMPSGFYNLHPHFAGFLEIPFLLGSAIAIFARGLGILRVCAVIFAVVAFIGIVLSQSRGALMAIAVGVLVLAVTFLFEVCKTRRFVWSRRKLSFCILGTSLVLVVSGIFVLNNYQKRFSSLDSFFSGSGRQNFWVGAIDQWLESPLLGTGARSFHYRYPEYRPPEAPFHQRNPEFAHNDYLQQAAEYGLIGLVLILGILILHMRSATRDLRGAVNEENKINDGGSGSLQFAILAGATATITAHSLHAFVDFHTRMVATAIPIGFCFAILVTSGLGSVKSNGQYFSLMETWSGLGARWIAFLGGIGIFIFAGHYGIATWELEKAHLQIKSGKPELAVVHLQKAIELDPTNADPWRSLGVVRYFRKEDNLPAFVKVQFQSKALDAYLRAIDLNPFDGFSYIGAGNCEMSLAWQASASEADGYWSSARKHFERAISLAPTQYKPREAHALFLLNFAYYLNSIGRFEEASKEAQLALKEFNEVPKFFVEGAPRGHRASSGASGARALIKQLNDRKAIKNLR